MCCEWAHGLCQKPANVGLTAAFQVGEVRHGRIWKWDTALRHVPGLAVAVMEGLLCVVPASSV